MNILSSEEVERERLFKHSPLHEELEILENHKVLLHLRPRPRRLCSIKRLSHGGLRQSGGLAATIDEDFFTAHDLLCSPVVEEGDEI
jgi:hypothetical protein